MSLLCVRCGKIIVMSNHPDHLGLCAACGVKNLTLSEEEKSKITDVQEARRQEKQRSIYGV